MKVKERQLVSVRQASAQPSRVEGGWRVLLISRRPFSAQVLLAGGLGLGVAEAQGGDEVGVVVEAKVVVVVGGGQIVRKAVSVVVLVCLLKEVV